MVARMDYSDAHIENMLASAMQPYQIMEYLVHQAGGCDSGQKRAAISEGDVEDAIICLSGLKQSDPDLFYNICLNEGRLSRLFWTDFKCQVVKQTEELGSVLQPLS